MPIFYNFNNGFLQPVVIAFVFDVGYKSIKKNKKSNFKTAFIFLQWGE